MLRAQAEQSQDINNLTQDRKLLKVVEQWLREERDSHREEVEMNPAANSCRAGAESHYRPNQCHQSI